jgi:DNA-directed RNA polymerase subunit RPC12/RpoP
MKLILIILCDAFLVWLVFALIGILQEIYFDRLRKSQPAAANSRLAAPSTVHPIRCYECSSVNRFSFYQLIYRARELNYETHICADCGKQFTVQDLPKSPRPAPQE